MTTISTQDLEALVEQFERADWREMHLRIGDFELYLSKDGDAPVKVRTEILPAGQAPSAAPSPTAPQKPAARKAPVAEVPPGWVQVRAPSLGTFYRAPKPGAPAFAETGARVSADSELCLIEVMKLFTTMRAGVGGVVREVYAEDGQLVEFDQPLFLLEPDA